MPAKRGKASPKKAAKKKTTKKKPAAAVKTAANGGEKRRKNGQFAPGTKPRNAFEQGNQAARANPYTKALHDFRGLVRGVINAEQMERIARKAAAMAEAGSAVHLEWVTKVYGGIPKPSEWDRVTIDDVPDLKTAESLGDAKRLIFGEVAAGRCGIEDGVRLMEAAEKVFDAYRRDELAEMLEELRRERSTT